MAGTKLRILLVTVGLAMLCAPVWWLTTRVYRADLPYHALESLQSIEQARFKIQVEFIFISKSKNGKFSHEAFVQRACEALNEVESGDSQTQRSLFKVSYTCSGTPMDLESLAKAKPSEKGYNIFVGHQISEESIPSAFRGSSAIVEADLAGLDINTFAMRDVAKTLQAAFFRFNTNSNEAIKHHQNVQVTFSLLVEDSRATVSEWPANELVDAFSTRVSQTFGSLTRFSVDSQVLPFASTTHRPPKRDAKSGQHYYVVSDLPHFVNANEWKIESTSSKGATINLLLFVPAEDHSPLQIRTSADPSSALTSTAFLIPQWGAVRFVNNPDKIQNGTLKLSRDVLKPAIAECLVLLRRLMGLPERPVAPTSSQVRILSSSDVVAHRYEMEALLRSSIALNLDKAKSTLISFGKMVEDLRAIPIKNELLHEIDYSLKSIEMAYDVALHSQWADSLQHAMEASEAAERIFFNKDMLAMLYFPDEHVFAIYVPLFVPICFPLVTGLWHEISRRRRRAKEAAASRLKSD